MVRSKTLVKNGALRVRQWYGFGHFRDTLPNRSDKKDSLGNRQLKYFGEANRHSITRW